MRETIPPLPNTPSWRGSQLKKGRGTTLPLPFTAYLEDCRVVYMSVTLCNVEILAYYTTRNPVKVLNKELYEAPKYMIRYTEN
jgi:hypothetical protein